MFKKDSYYIAFSVIASAIATILVEVLVNNVYSKDKINKIPTNIKKVFEAIQENDSLFFQTLPIILKRWISDCYQNDLKAYETITNQPDNSSQTDNFNPLTKRDYSDYIAFFLRASAHEELPKDSRYLYISNYYSKNQEKIEEILTHLEKSFPSLEFLEKQSQTHKEDSESVQKKDTYLYKALSLEIYQKRKTGKGVNDANQEKNQDLLGIYECLLLAPNKKNNNEAYPESIQMKFNFERKISERLPKESSNKESDQNKSTNKTQPNNQCNPSNDSLIHYSHFFDGSPLIHISIFNVPINFNKVRIFCDLNFFFIPSFGVSRIIKRKVFLKPQAGNEASPVQEDNVLDKQNMTDSFIFLRAICPSAMFNDPKTIQEQKHLIKWGYIALSNKPQRKNKKNIQEKNKAIQAKLDQISKDGKNIETLDNFVHLKKENVILDEKIFFDLGLDSFDTYYCHNDNELGESILLDLKKLQWDLQANTYVVFAYIRKAVISVSVKIGEEKSEL